MRERPILFSGPMVRAILDGRKTQTRRVVKPQPGEHIWSTMHGYRLHVSGPHLLDTGLLGIRFQHSIPQNQVGEDPIWASCKFGQPGDRLWVKETFRFDGIDHRVGMAERRKGDLSFRADMEADRSVNDCPWRPSIFMPRWASRITLEITGVRVERLQDISGTDSISEGIDPSVTDLGGSIITTFRDYLTGRTDRAARQSYQSLWESINGAGSWDANPWVWVIEFRRVEK